MATAENNWIIENKSKILAR